LGAALLLAVVAGVFLAHGSQLSGAFLFGFRLVWLAAFFVGYHLALFPLHKQMTLTWWGYSRGPDASDQDREDYELMDGRLTVAAIALYLMLVPLFVWATWGDWRYG